MAAMAAGERVCSSMKPYSSPERHDVFTPRAAGTLGANAGAQSLTLTGKARWRHPLAASD